MKLGSINFGKKGKLELKITPELFWSGVRYFIVGFSTFLLDYFLNKFLIEDNNVHYIISTYVVSPFVLAYNFILHRIWSFKDKEATKSDVRRQGVRYVILVIFNSLMAAPLMYLYYDFMAMPLLWAKVFGTATVITWNFPLYRLWVYKKDEK